MFPSVGTSSASYLQAKGYSALGCRITGLGDREDWVSELVHHNEQALKDLPRYPGVIVLNGALDDVDEFVRRLKVRQSNDAMSVFRH